jgi:hypothetical protein
MLLRHDTPVTLGVDERKIGRAQGGPIEAIEEA